MKPKNTPEQVAHYYDTTTPAYQQATGDIIQAFRPASDDELLQAISSGAGIKNAMRILDAGCGLCAPAIWFAQHADIRIDAITISNVQVAEAEKKINAAGVQHSVRVMQGDYHRLAELFPENTFDVVLFIESMGHAADVQAAVRGAYHVLKPGGFIYIKDFTWKETRDSALEKEYQSVVEAINRNYAYNVLNLTELIFELRKCGFLIDFIKKPDYESDYSYTVKFELAVGIETWKEMARLKPGEWFELRFQKPPDANFSAARSSAT